MQRIAHAMGQHFFYHSFIGLYHYERFAGLERDHQVVESQGVENFQEFIRCIYHSFGGISILGDDPGGKRTQVGTNTNGCTVFLAAFCKGFEPLANDLFLFFVLFCGVMDLIAGGWHRIIISGVDPHFLHIPRSNKGYLRIEMDVGNERMSESCFPYPVTDLFQGVGGLNIGCRHTHIIGTGLNNADALLYGGFNIQGIGIGHRLQADRISSPHGPVTNGYFMTRKTGDMKKTTMNHSTVFVGIIPGKGTIM